MFARAGVTGRILRHGRDGTAPVSLHPFLARPKKKPKTKCYCYVPMVWQALVAVLAGLLGLMGGTAMCTVGYYALPLATEEHFNGTHLVPDVDEGARGHLHSLAYVGPVLMGIGCFVIVVSCVHVCEIRDQKIKEFEEKRKAEEAKRGGKAKNRKALVYERIINQLRNKIGNESKATSRKAKKTKCCHDVESGPSHDKMLTKSKHRELLKGLLRRCSALSVTSTRSDYSNISLALKTIPMDIFTVDMEGNKDTSLLPIKVLAPKQYGNTSSLSNKFPSDPCLSKSSGRSHKACQLPKSLQAASKPDKPLDLAYSVDHPRIKPISVPGNDSHATEEPYKKSMIKPAAKKGSASNIIVHQASVHYEYEQPARTAWSHDGVCSTAGNAGSPSTTSQGETDHFKDVIRVGRPSFRSNSTEESGYCDNTSRDSADWKDLGKAHSREQSGTNGSSLPPRTSLQSRRATLPNGDCSAKGKSIVSGPIISLPFSTLNKDEPETTCKWLNPTYITKQSPNSQFAPFLTNEGSQTERLVKTESETISKRSHLYKSATSPNLQRSSWEKGKLYCDS